MKCAWSGIGTTHKPVLCYFYFPASLFLVMNRSTFIYSSKLIFKMTETSGQVKSTSINAEKSFPEMGIPLHERPTIYNWQTTNDAGYTINEEPSGTVRHLRVVCVGAGASGINLARFVQERLQNVELVIYEKNEDVGGTWMENRYP